MTQVPGPEFPPIRGDGSGHSQPPRAPGMATAALVVSILGFCGVTAVIGLVLGIVGLGRAKAAGAGAGRALTAIVLSSVWIIAGAILLIVGVIAGPSPSTSTGPMLPSASSEPSVEQSSVSGGEEAAVSVSELPSAPAPEDAPAEDLVPVEPDTAFPNESEVDGISFEWVDKPNCSDFACFQMRVSADSTECLDGLYVEINLLDDQDTIVGFSNDTVGSLREGQRALLTFDVTEDNVESAEVSQFSCH